MKKTARNIIILHTCSNYDNNTRYSSWDTKWDRHNFLSFWAFSALYLLSPNNLENQNFENMKKVSGMSSFCTCVRGIATGGDQEGHAPPLLNSNSKPKTVQQFQFQISGILFFMGVQKLYGPEFYNFYSVYMLQFLYNLWQHFIFSNYIWEIDHFMLDFLKMSST